MYIGIDIGGTAIKGAQVVKNELQHVQSVPVNGDEDLDVFSSKVIGLIELLFNDEVKAIGLGAPGIVDHLEGVVYDIQNIPLLTRVPLKEMLESRFKVPVYVNNDANCFALGEHYFGQGKIFSNFIGLAIGTGLGVGIIIKKALYTGEYCGAGEIGVLPYKNKTIESYTASSFFHMYKTTGEALYKKALQNDPEALRIFKEFGTHLGYAVTVILHLYAPQAIILGGSISKAYPYFKEPIHEALKKFDFQKQLANFQILVTQEPKMGILGAAALCLDAHSKK